MASQVYPAHGAASQSRVLDIHGNIISRNSRIVIVGAGPAGVHMASRLSKMGFSNTKVLERNPEGSFGKSHTYKHVETGDIPHEMGTCYLSASYKEIPKLFERYVGPDALIQPGGGPKGSFGTMHCRGPKLDMEKGMVTVTTDEWLYANLERENFAKQLWILPDKLQAVAFVADTIKYTNLHRSLLGAYDYHGLPPKPTPDNLEKMNKTYRELMEENGLEGILDLTVVGFGSYGFGYDVPALYGLWFVTPPALQSMIKRKLFSHIKAVRLARHGFTNLWRQMVEKDQIQIRYGS